MAKFKNQYIVTKDLFVEQYTDELHVWLFVLSCLTCITTAYIHWWVISAITLVLAVVCGIMIVVAKSELKKEYEVQVVAHDNLLYEVETNFYDDHFELVTNYGANEVLSYGTIVRSSKRKNLIVLFVDRGYAIGVKKDSFTEGTLEGFQHFMSVKGF